jgi:D-lactate dehydrogenase
VGAGLAVDRGPAADRAPDWVALGTPEPLLSQLTGAVGRDQVLTRALDLIAYASDASPYRLIPKAVVMPSSIEHVVALLRFARHSGTPLVFRAGGTSLNGQTQTDSVLVDVRRHWQWIHVLEDGAAVRVGPGTVLGRVNRALARYGRRLGPDPASTDIACVGGVIANNSGGMRCGIVADSYRTLRSLKFVLANGTVIDTADRDAGARFSLQAPELAAGLDSIRDELRADEELVERIRRKFEIKNTMGYRLCGFLDADEPLEIFRRLIVGSEGTLAFVGEAVFETVPLHRHTTIALVFFEDVDAACDAVGPLRALGASATELMVAPTLIAAGHSMPGTPGRWKELPPTSAALLVEFSADRPEALDGPEREALSALEGRPLLDAPRFTREREEIELVWRVREGMQGLLAAVRPPGVQLIHEDVCVRPERVAEMATDLQALLSKHGFLPGVAGHAYAGNLHFLLTPNFGEQGDLERYDAFMHELVELIVGKYDGSLKAEHGTGVNMAPFVEREWGAKAVELMWRVKRLADPDGILGPGIVLNRDPGVHLRNLKSTPEIEQVATKCIECGFCEPVCPSRNVTTTPRQRIVLRREMARQAADSPVLRALTEQFGYDGIDTCAADSSCAGACPVGIDTGKLIKSLRRERHSPPAEWAAALVARRYRSAERAARLALRIGAVPARLGGRNVPGPARARLPAGSRQGATAVYLPACINRIFGGPPLVQALVALSARAGQPLWIPDDVAGHCCATPWSSKGFERGHELMAERTAEAIARWSDGGRLEVVVDASSCVHGLSSNGVAVLDAIVWVHDRLLPELRVQRRLRSVAVHPTCSATQLGLASKLLAIAETLAEEVVIPPASGCCGMAGDRGWLHPELPASALRDVAQELSERSFDAYISSNRTCELALEQVTGRPYESFVIALERATTAAAG